MNQTFKYKIKKIVNVKRAYPANELARLFLQLNNSRGAKTFTDEKLKLIRKIGKQLNFNVEGE